MFLKRKNVKVKFRDYTISVLSPVEELEAISSEDQTET